ncbi:MAG: aminotransferase class III-fold pyridoxal phosphate-dependent enzyme [Nitrospirae bacterium]|nr:aminotransferase class III-fold pyridoxal phosphate-dependent enzyme [Nitrospirota bacterium]MBI5694772.1 aminotransferase class III-fold pyridoxal phosphate-dependent enzyme [Nitrospirota bacterium]
MKYPSFKKSVELLAQVRGIIPGAAQTFSKGPTQFSAGSAPNFIVSGKGCRLTDLDGNELIDYSSSLGAVTLGYAYPAVDRAVAAQMKRGMSLTLPSPLEYELGMVLKDIYPCAEMVRYGKNGSDATSGAVRAARAITGREVVACCGYHGWQDWYIATTTRDRGIPGGVKALTKTFDYNDPASLERVFEENNGNVACVIMEATGVVRPEKNFLKEVKRITHKHGALLIFDEVVTGFRLALGGAQEFFGVVPDMACIGKGMGNGMPISAVVGKKRFMKVFDEIFFSFTFGGEALSLAASLATISEMKRHDVPGHMARMGQTLMDGYNALAKKHGLEDVTKCVGYPCRNIVSLKDETGQESLLVKTFFQQEAVARGVLFCGYHNYTLSHKVRDILATLSAYDGALAELKDALGKGGSREIKKRLNGELLQPVFRKL